jgi:hypothetical protein
MATKRIAWKPEFEGDEIALGVALAFALHALPIAALAIHVIFPSPPSADEPVVARPVIGATLLKLGKPIDPSKLPDRFVPRARTAPQQKLTASREEPLKKAEPDAGPPPPNTQESDIARLIAKSDPFAEDAGKDRPEEGRAEGVEGGLETDPNKVKAGDMYAAKLNAYFHERWQIPTVISQGEASRLCVTIEANVSPRMKVWHVKQEPVRKSGNDLFDDSARTMFQKLLDDGASLPEPPPEMAETYRGRTIRFFLSGDPHGDTSRCK